MNGRFWVALFLGTLVSQVVLASPVLLLCVTKAVTRDGMGEPALFNRESYQIAFDEAQSTVAVDGNPPEKASITPTLIDWGRDSHAGAWHIDRLTGDWYHLTTSDSDLPNGFHVPERRSGICTSPPKPKF